MPLRGISLLDLLATVPGAGLIPSDVADQLENLAVLDHTSTASAGAFVHYGTVRSVADMGLPALQSWPVEIPGLNEGLPFQLTFTRAATATSGSTLEGAPTEWRLDLMLKQVSIVIPDLKPAKPAGGSGVNALHLVADATRSRVRIYGSGTFRIASTATSGGVVARFVDQPDTFDPAAPTGTVLTLGFDPPSFFFGDSQFGLTIDRLTYDDDENYTPPEIEARGHDPSWRGISIKEATFFPPPNLPVLGDVSVGVRDVLLGSPFGIQGEVRLEFGQTPVDPANVTYLQLVDGRYQSMGAASGNADDGYEIEFLPNTPASAQVRVQLGSGAMADWWLPARTNNEDFVSNTNDSGQFEAEDGSLITFRTHETAQDGSDALSPMVGTFYKHSTADSGHAPQIKVTLAGSDKPNCVSLRGPAEKLAGLVLTADPATDPSLVWSVEMTDDVPGDTGATFTLPTLDGPRFLNVVLTDSKGRKRRVQVYVAVDGPLVAGCALSAFDEHGNPMPLHGLDSTYNLDPFHSSDAFLGADTPATVSGSTATVPQGELARVTLEASGNPQDPDNPPPAAGGVQELVQVEMVFNDTTELRWGAAKPADANNWSPSALTDWADKFPGAKFIVIGRCCDLPGDDANGTQINKTLADRRASEGASLLAGYDVHARGEQTPFTDSADIAAQTLATSWNANQFDGSWLIHDEQTDYASWGTGVRDRDPRPHYRRVDIYAVGGTPAADAPTDPNDAAQADPAQLNALVPGADSTSPAAPARREPTLPYRVLLVVQWDSPTVVGWGDAIPTLVELTIAWQPHALALPGAPSGPDSNVALQHTTPGAPDIWTVKGHLAHDARTGQTLITLSVEEEGGDDRGIADFENNIAAGALGLGPALVAGISAAGVDGAAVRIGALIAAGVFLGAFGKNGKVVIHKVELQDRQDTFTSFDNGRQRIVLDYVVSIGFEFHEGPIDLKTSDDHPLKIKYKNVGLEWDDSKQGLDAIGLVFDNVSFDIQDPGHWTLTGPLGELLRVVASRSGSGSNWMEVDLRFAIDLGIVTITGATIRASFDDSGNLSVELRGLQVKADIADVLKGTGGVRLMPGGGIAANVDVQLEPITIEVEAQIVIDMPEVALEMGVLFAVGIPLANSGLGLYGFIGRFVVNGARTLTSTSPDPIQKEIDWYHATLDQKYGKQQGAWGLGLGAVIGTLPDTAYTFNATGSIALSFPDPSVVLAIDAKFITKPSLPSEDGAGGSPTTGLSLLGLVAIDETALKIGIRGEYLMPHVLDVKVPINAYFPFPGNPDAPYVRIGADDINGRTGPPITLTLLPDSLNVQAWSYIMIEAHELHALGGDTSLNFDGFAVGFGAGFELKYGSDSVGLDVSAKMLLGFGTKPMMLVGKISIHGSLNFVVVSVSVDGQITLTLTEDEQYLQGHFCGSVDCFFFSISGCVDVSWGTLPATPIPPPDHPLTGVDLTDRRAVVTGIGKLDGSSNPVPVVWPDTVPVLHFSHYVDTQLGTGSAFSPGQAATAPPWSGSNELKYCFRITAVDLLDSGGNPVPGPLDSGWWLPTFRPGVSTGTSPAASSEEGRDLGLLAWNPAPWARNLITGGAGLPADPAATLGSVCDPTPTPTRVCMYGEDAVGEGPGLVVLAADEPTPGPFPSYAELHGDGTVPPLGLVKLLALISELGAELWPGDVENLAVPPSDGSVTAAFRLPLIARYGEPLLTVPWIGRYSTPLVDPELTLAVCLSRKTGEGGYDCSDLTELKREGRSTKQLTWESVSYTSAKGSLVQVETGGGLLVGVGLSAQLPHAVESVDLSFSGVRGGLRVTGLDALGDVLDDFITLDGADSVTLSGEGIVTVRIAPQKQPDKRAALTKLCYSERPHPATFAAAFEMERIGNAPSYTSVNARAGYPVVEGRHTEDGDWIPWTPKLGEVARGTDGECVYVEYDPPDSGPWWGFRVTSMVRFPILMVNTCGVTWTAAAAAAADAENRATIGSTVNTQANPGGDPLPAQHPILQPDSDYAIRVQGLWQGWQSTHQGDAPPPPSDTAWQALPDQTYHLHTAAEPASPPVTAANFADESTFDPRATARYLIGFDPDGSGPPHFLDDPIRANFTVDHLPQLLGLYGRDLQLKLRKTSQPPGALAGGGHPPDEPHTTKWGQLQPDLMSVADRRMTQAMDDAPCLATAPLGGATASIDADLAPSSGYDLLLVASPTATPDSDDILVARNHFRTSRYRNPGEMLTALGLTSTDAFPILPHDALLDVSQSLPSSAVTPADDALEATLSAVDLDPWPLPPEPRTVAIWQPDGIGGWLLAGVMLETDEALLRPVDLSTVQASVGTTAFAGVRSNTAGTRVMLAAVGGPAAVNTGDTLILTLVAGGSTWLGIRRLETEPRLSYQETK